MKKISIALGFIASLGAMQAAADLHPSCEAYFKEIDSYADAVAKQTNSAEMAQTIKSQYEASKQAVQQMPKDSQEQMCTQAIEMLKQARAASGV
jgi:gas vesicle protein